MFQTISIISLVVVAVALVWHYKAYPCQGNLNLDCCEREECLLKTLKKWGILLALACCLGLFLTGFGPRLLAGTALSGYPLMLHASVAPVFVIVVAFCVLTWSQQCRLDDRDLEWLQRLMKGECSALLKDSTLGMKLSYWLAAFLVIPVSLSMVMSMFPIFGTHGQETLFEMHRYFALALVMVVVVHVYLAIRTQFKVKS